MKRIILLCIFIFCAAAGVHAQFAGGIVYRSDNTIVPVVTAELWSEESLRVHLDALLGYHSKNVQLGYSISYRFQLTPNLALDAGVAYLGAIETMRLHQLTDKLGVFIGFRVQLR